MCSHFHSLHNSFFLSASNSCIFASSTDTATVDAEHPICTNVVKSVSYNIKHAQDSYSSIETASAVVILTDVQKSLTQSFSIKFYDDGDNSRTSTEGKNILNILYSLSSSPHHDSASLYDYIS